MLNEAKRRWANFICSSPNGGRFLASIGSVVDWSTTLVSEEARTKAFIERLVGGAHDIRYLAGVVDLIQSTYLIFVQKDLARVLDYLSSEFVRVDEIVGPGLRGNPRWDKTIIGRTSGQLPLGRYYSRTARRTFEKPENQLLKWLVTDLLNSYRDIVRRTGADRLHPQLLKLATACEHSLEHHWFSSINVPDQLEYRMLVAGRRHQRIEYRRAAVLALRRSELGSDSEISRWKATLELLSSGWLEPVNEDDIFELFGLVLVLDVIGEELGFGSPVEYGLVTAARKHVAKFENERYCVHVFFDQSPREALGVLGRYTAIVKQHRGITGSEHRPDIAVRLRDKSLGSTSTIFVEVKRSSASRYLSESVYKAFGYIFDFAAVWETQQKNPKIVVLVPEEVVFIGDSPQEVMFVSSREAMARALNGLVDIRS